MRASGAWIVDRGSGIEVRIARSLITTCMRSPASSLSVSLPTHSLQPTAYSLIFRPEPTAYSLLLKARSIQHG